MLGTARIHSARIHAQHGQFPLLRSCRCAVPFPPVSHVRVQYIPARLHGGNANQLWNTIRSTQTPQHAAGSATQARKLERGRPAGRGTFLIIAEVMHRTVCRVVMCRHQTRSGLPDARVLPFSSRQAQSYDITGFRDDWPRQHSTFRILVLQAMTGTAPPSLKNSRLSAGAFCEFCGTQWLHGLSLHQTCATANHTSIKHFARAGDEYQKRQKRLSHFAQRGTVQDGGFGGVDQELIVSFALLLHMALLPFCRVLLPLAAAAAGRQCRACRAGTSSSTFCMTGGCASG